MQRGQDRWSRYYGSQAILIPPPVEELGLLRPEHLITANALVWKPALEAIGGLNETFRIAAGEDIDLGFRLREVGALSYAPTAAVSHDFDLRTPGIHASLCPLWQGEQAGRAIASAGSGPASVSREGTIALP